MFWLLIYSLPILLIHEVSKMSSEQAKIPRNMWMQITVNLQRKNHYLHKSCWKYSITYSVRISTMIARNGCLLQPHKHKDVDATVWLHCQSQPVQAFPFLNDTLLQLLHILDFLGVDPLLKKTPYLLIDRVEVSTIWRPQWWRDEVGHLTLQQIDRFFCAQWAGAPSCWKVK